MRNNRVMPPASIKRRTVQSSNAFIVEIITKAQQIATLRKEWDELAAHAVDYSASNNFLYTAVAWANVNDHRLKAVASGYGLKPDWVGPKGRLANSLDDFEVVVGNLGLLILNILLPHLVRHVAARGNPIAPTPEMLTPIPFAKRLIFRQQFVGALAFEILHRPRH